MEGLAVVSVLDVGRDELLYDMIHERAVVCVVGGEVCHRECVTDSVRVCRIPSQEYCLYFNNC